MAILRSPYFFVPLFLNVAALGAILTGPLQQPGVPTIWLVLMALTAPWVVALLVRRLRRQGEDDHRDFV